MTTQYWLVKQEPDSYAWSTFLADGKTAWEGVRNFQARNNLSSMQVGDSVLFYESGEAKQVVGIAEVVRAAFPDATAETGESWVAVELKAVKALPRPVTLSEIKAVPELANIALVRNSRLSVSPLGKADYNAILKLAKKAAQ